MNPTVIRRCPTNGAQYTIIQDGRCENLVGTPMAVNIFNFREGSPRRFGMMSTQPHLLVVVQTRNDGKDTGAHPHCRTVNHIDDRPLTTYDTFDLETNSSNCAITGTRSALPSYKHKCSSGKVVDRGDRIAYLQISSRNLDPAAYLI